MPIKRLPVTRFARGIKLARLTASVGAQAIGDTVAGLFAAGSEKAAQKLLSQVKQAQKITTTLSEMKGAAMKLGQILSIHGEHLFPKEVVDVLAKLQQSSVEMEFDEIEKVLISELGTDYADRLKELSRQPIASASIGQVHLATDAASGVPLAVKVQYPGVERSIDSDVDSLASLFSVLTRLPSTQGFNAVTEEIKLILRQETDYLKEAEHGEFFAKAFAGDARLVVPRVVRDATTSRVLTTELAQGISVQEFAASTASPEARANLGRKYLDVYYRELFSLGRVQTDPNFANYKVRWSFGVQEPGLVLLDFGAVKVFGDEFRAKYKRLMQACVADDYDEIREHAVALDFLREDDSKELVDLHYELARLLMEPLEQKGPFRWADSDLPARLRKLGMKLVFAFKLRPPPRDVIFLNRKLAGVYFFCSAIKAEFDPRPVLEPYLR